MLPSQPGRPMSMIASHELNVKGIVCSIMNSPVSIYTLGWTEAL